MTFSDFLYRALHGTPSPEEQARIAGETAEAVRKAGGSEIQANSAANEINGFFKKYWPASNGAGIGMGVVIAVGAVVLIALTGDGKRGNTAVGVAAIGGIGLLWYMAARENPAGGSELPDLRGLPGVPVPEGLLVYEGQPTVSAYDTAEEDEGETE
jgi:hypothetical protein